jgi:predicted  nucleic acid-binding Zn-ribbon protein
VARKVEKLFNRRDRILNLKNGILENAQNKNVLLKGRIQNVKQKQADMRFELETMDVKIEKIQEEIEAKKDEKEKKR